MDRETSAGPFVKSFTVAGAVYALLLIFLGVNVPDFAYKAGSLLGTCTTPAILTGIVANCTSVKRSWLAVLVVYLGVCFMLFVLLGRRYLSV